MTKLERANEYQEQNRIAEGERPVFHVTPPTGWMNDPNGFSIYQGNIHLFYQYHPYSDIWGPMHWGHYISEDFVKWKELPVALAPDRDYDATGCFSGSAIETKDGQAVIYTGVMERVREDGTKEITQNQCLAIGDGVRYEKAENNPVIMSDMLPKGFSREDFRDPKIWEEDGTYYLVVASQNKDRNGQVLLFQSENLKHWEYISVLADNREIYGKMWECPDFFALGTRHVLVVSPMDMQADGKEFHNGNQSMAMIGCYDRQEHQLKNGMMTIPRQLALKDGVLYQNPVEELIKYRVEPVVCKEQSISGSVRILGVKGRVMDLTLELVDGDYEAFTIYFAKNERYFVSFRYVRATGTIEFDRTYSGMIRDAVCQRTMNIKKMDKKLKLRLILDKFSVELFVNDGVQTFTSTFYTPLNADDIVLECDKTAVVNIEKYGLRLD